MPNPSGANQYSKGASTTIGRRIQINKAKTRGKSSTAALSKALAGAGKKRKSVKLNASHITPAHGAEIARMSMAMAGGSMTRKAFNTRKKQIVASYGPGFH